MADFIQDLNNQIKSLFMQQPPVFVLTVAGQAFVVPFAAVTGSKVNLPEDWSDAAQSVLDQLKLKMTGKDVRAKQLMEILTQ